MALLGIGCAAPRRAPVPSAPTRATVRLEALVRRHPLWPELARLDALANDARRGGDTGARDGGATPAWPAPAPMDDLRASTLERREAARRRLELALQEGLSGFAAGETERLEIFLAGRRRELEAEERRNLTERERELRGAADREAQALLDRLADDLALLRTSRDGLDAQLREGFRITVSPETLTAELERLKGTTASLEDRGGARGVAVTLPPGNRGYSPRARLTAARDAIDRLVQRLEGEIATRRVSVDRRMDEEMAALRKEASRRVEARVEQLREQRSVEVEPILERHEFEDRLERTLGMEAASAVRLDDIGATRHAPASRWSRKASGADGGARAAADIRRVRDALERRLRAEVADRVRDAAQERRVDVTFGDVPGVPDRTDAFGRWIWDRSEL